MSRGGRGGFRGRGRGSFGGGAGGGTLPPMGLSFADLQNLSREATALYPTRHLPIFTNPTEEEAEIAQLQLGFINRLKESPYFVTETKKTNELEKYSDKYRPAQNTHATLASKRKEMNKEFFPSEVWEDYFNPKKKQRTGSKSTAKKVSINLDDFNDSDHDEEKSDNEGSQASVGEQSDYDVDEEYDNDYAENYFDNGEGDDMDNLGDGGGDEGGGEYD